jgi:hypothetical protein
MNELRERTLVVLEDVRHLFVVLQVGAKMRHGLTGKLVEQIGLVVVRDVVEIDQGAYEVVLQPIFFEGRLAGHELLAMIALEVLDEDLVVNRLIADVPKVEVEISETGRDLSRRNNADAWDVDRLLDEEVDGSADDGSEVRLLDDPFDRLLPGVVGVRDFPDDRSLHLGLLQIA